MGKAGRKGWKEELDIGRRYTDLSEDFFAILKEFAQSEDKADRKWAAEQLGKGFVKMIPQQVESPDGGFVLKIVPESGNRYGVSSNSEKSSD